MKKLYIVLLCIAGIFMLLIGFVAGCFIDGKCNYKYENTNDSLKSWMNYIKDDTIINEMIIPGSHNACSYGMVYLGECQKFDMSKQLNLGCRYFDIRIENNDGKYTFFHDIIKGKEAEPIFPVIKKFLADNPSEFLVLDFQKFKDGSDQKVVEFINTYLIDIAISNTTDKSDLEFVDGLTLGSVRGKCIIIFGDNSTYTSLPYILNRNGDSCSSKSTALNSMYDGSYNKLTSLEYIEKGLPVYIENIKNKKQTEGYKGLFVLQAQLTDGKKIFGPWSRERVHDENMSLYISSLNTSADFEYINIIMRDFVNQSKMENIIRMNYYKYNFKDECENTFMNVFKVA